jgi:hypothetical protein
MSDVDWEDMQDDIDRLLQSVDFFIRTRNRFDSRSPLSYSVPLTTIVADAKLVNEFCDLLEDYPQLPYRNLRSLIDSPVGRTKFDLTTRSIDVYVSVGYLTPMQVDSDHRLFGYFQCGDDGCRNTWKSAASWTNKWQQCKRCESKCYPYDQHFLQKFGTRDASGLRPHHMARCERCQELGELCLPDYYYAL